MSKSWWGKFFFMVFVVVLALVYVYPTVANLDLTKTKYPFKQKVNYGLDLQGGVYMVLGTDFNRVFAEIAERRGSALLESLKEKGVAATSVKTLKEGPFKEDPRVEIAYDTKDQAKAHDVVKEFYGSVFRITEDRPGVMQLGLAREQRDDIRERTISQSIEVIRNRIDEFGVAEPSITSQGLDRVVVELPGVKDVERAKELIGRTARLEFKLVNDKGMNQAQIASVVQQIEEEQKIKYVEGGAMSFSEYTRLINEKAQGKIPADSQILFEREVGIGGQVTQRIPYLVFNKADVTGEDIQDAVVSINPEQNRPEVSLSFNPKGAQAFDKVTGDHTGERFAIVLDNIVHSAPVIQTRISNGRASITLGQANYDQSMQEAKDLATVLRAGALPAQLEFLEQRVVGPSLGQDSIQKGVMAGLIGALAVFLFTIFYYRVSGLIAVFSLILNVIFLLACLVGLEATLTLPGIAGIALTVGIAVDSNVVIYERIREELRAGKSLHGALESGFQKAFRTILDANVTNAAAAVVLLMYGTGPIKGFAVTMLIGIIMTLFTAVFVCKLIFDLYLHRVEQRGGKTISI